MKKSIAILVCLAVLSSCGATEKRTSAEINTGGGSFGSTVETNVANDIFDSAMSDFSAEPPESLSARLESSTPMESKESSFDTGLSITDTKSDAKTESDASAPTEASDFSLAETTNAGMTERQDVLKIEENQQRNMAGQLTAGEWNDNANYDFLKNIMQRNYDWSTFTKNWRVNLSNRIVVEILNNEQKPLENIEVKLVSDNDKDIFIAKTDNKGIANLFVNYDKNESHILKTIVIENNESIAYEQGKDFYSHTLNGMTKDKSLDIMFMVDTTGSMGDELKFLALELENVIKNVKKDNGNLYTRLSVNFYRDYGDEYVVLPSPFNDDILSEVAHLREQTAEGGGDFEEAVDVAFDNAVNGHEWNKNATKILFFVLDAPPHNTEEIVNDMIKLTKQASQKGIRVVPVASSGIDKETEFILRAMSMATGGTYIFLTDDSGIGDSHIEPTIGNYEVEYLNKLMVRVINSYLE